MNAVPALDSDCRQGAGCRVQSSGFRVQGSGFRVQGAGSRVQGPGSRARDDARRLERCPRARQRLPSGCRVQSSGFRVQGSGFRDSGFRVQGYVPKLDSDCRARPHRPFICLLWTRPPIYVCVCQGVLVRSHVERRCSKLGPTQSRISSSTLAYTKILCVVLDTLASN